MAALSANLQQSVGSTLLWVNQDDENPAQGLPPSATGGREARRHVQMWIKGRRRERAGKSRVSSLENAGFIAESQRPSSRQSTKETKDDLETVKSRPSPHNFKVGRFALRADGKRTTSRAKRRKKDTKTPRAKTEPVLRIRDSDFYSENDDPISSLESPSCPVIVNKSEASELRWTVERLNESSQLSKSLFKSVMTPDFAIGPRISTPGPYNTLDNIVYSNRNCLQLACYTKNGPEFHADPIEARLEFTEMMTSGCHLLQAGSCEKAFMFFGNGFKKLEPMVNQLCLQGQSVILSLLIRFRSPIFEPLWNQLYQQIGDLARIHFDGDNIITDTTKLFRRSPLPKAVAAESILRCMLDVFQTSLGHMHPESIGVHETLAWSLLDKNCENEAFQKFKKLEKYHERLTGQNSMGVCEALRGAAEAQMKLGNLDLAEELLNEIMEKRSLEMPAHQRSLLHMRCLISLSMLNQNRNNWLQSQWLLSQANTLADSSLIKSNSKGQRLRLEIEGQRLKIQQYESKGQATARITD